jgi:hypothetical protein
VGREGESEVGGWVGGERTAWGQLIIIIIPITIMAVMRLLFLVAYSGEALLMLSH